MSTSRRPWVFVIVVPLLIAGLGACTVDAPSPSTQSPSPPPSPSASDGIPSGDGVDLEASPRLYGGACEAMSTNAPDGWVESVLPIPSTWGLQIAALGGIVCHRQGAESATIIALPAGLRPSDRGAESAGCSQALECAVDVTRGDAWISGWVSPAAEGSDVAESFVVDFVDGLTEPEPLPAREFPSPTGLTLCDDPDDLASLERALDVKFSGAITETQYGGFAPAITQVAHMIAPTCNLAWNEADERRLAEVSVIPQAAWTIAELPSGESTTVDGAEDARWIVPVDPFALRRLIARSGDDLVFVSVDSEVDLAAAQNIAEAALLGE